MKKLTTLLILAFCVLIINSQTKPIVGTSLTINGTGICNAYIKDNLRANVLNLPSLSSYPTTPTPTRGDLINKGDTLKYYTGSMWINVGVFDTANIYKELNSKQDTGLSLLKSDTITKVVTISQLSDSLDSWNNSLAKKITADDTTWWGQSTDTTNISLRIDSCLKVADSTDYITSHAFNTDTVTASNTGTVPVYRYNYWNAKQSALTNPVTSESESYSSGRLPYFSGTTNTITGSSKATLTGLGGNAVLLIQGGSSSGNYMGFTAQITGGNASHFRYYHALGAPRALKGSTVITTGKGESYSGVVLTDDSKDYFKFYVNNKTTIGFEVPLGRSMLWASTIGSNTTNDKKWSANADYRAIWQNYSGGDYGDSVSISNAGVFNVPTGGNYNINNVPLINGISGYMLHANGTSTSDTSNLFWSGSRLGLGTASPLARLHLVSQEDVIYFDSYHHTNINTITFRSAAGTLASPKATHINKLLGGIVGRGYYTDGTPGFSSKNSAAMLMYAAENYTSTAQGSYIVFGTTPTGSTTRVTRMVINNDGSINYAMSPFYFQATIGSNTTNDKKWSATTNYRAIWQNYSGGAYGDSVSISNAGVINVPIGGNYYINSAKLNAANVDTSHNSTGIATYNDVLSQAGKDSIYDFNNGYIIPHNWSNSYMPTTYRRFNWFNGFGANPNNVSTNGIFYNGWFQASRIMSHLNKPLDYAAYFQQDGNGGTLQLYNLGTGDYINGISGGTVEFYVDGSGRGYFSGGIKTDANDTIFFGSDYLTGTGSGMITVGGGARIYSEGSLELDDEITTPEVVTDQISLNYTGSPQIAMTIGDHLGQLTINEASNFSNVEIKADSIELTGNITTTGTINGIKFLFVSDTLSSASILAGTVKQIIAAPGSGKYIKIISADLFYKHGGTDYVGAYTPIIDYVSSLDGKNYESYIAINSSTSCHNNLYDLAIMEGGSGAPSNYNIENKGIYLGLNNTPTTGNGYLKIDILYTINDY